MSPHRVPANLVRWLTGCGASPHPARARVLCLPPGGGSAQLYQRRPRLLGADLDAVAVELPGRGDRTLEPLSTSMAGVVAGVAGALDALDDLPLVVFGHSKGAVVGWELCRERHEATIDSWLVT